MIIGREGDKAYYDGIRGLVPCIAFEVTVDEILVKMDAKKGVLSWHGIQEYGDWDSFETWPHRLVIPEKAVRWPDGEKSFHSTILPYKWEIGS